MSDKKKGHKLSKSKLQESFTINEAASTAIYLIVVSCQPFHFVDLKYGDYRPILSRMTRDVPFMHHPQNKKGPKSAFHLIALI